MPASEERRRVRPVAASRANRSRPVAASARERVATSGTHPCPRRSQSRTRGSTVGSKAPSVRSDQPKTVLSSSETSASIRTASPGGAVLTLSSGPPGRQVVISASTRAISRTAFSLDSSAAARSGPATESPSSVPIASRCRSTSAGVVPALSAASTRTAPIRQRLSLNSREAEDGRRDSRGTGSVGREDAESARPPRRRVDPRSRFADNARPALAADAPHLVTVRQRQEPVALADLVLEALDAGLVELDDAAALIADQVVVVLPRAKAFVAIPGLPDPHAADNARVHEQIERPVDRGAGNLLVLGAQSHEELVRLEMLVPGEELVEQGLPLGGQFQAPPLQVLAEDVPFPAFHAIATQSQLRYSSALSGLCQARPEAADRVARIHDRAARGDRDVPDRRAHPLVSGAHGSARPLSRGLCRHGGFAGHLLRRVSFLQAR